MKNWYILKVQMGFENIVKTDIEITIKQKNLQNKIEHIIIPNTFTRKKNSLGYLFIKLEYSNYIFNVIIKIKNVIKFIPENKYPHKIDTEEIKKLINNLNTNNKYTQKTSSNYSIGENIRIKKGPFLDYIGKITYIDYRKIKVRVEILVFGRTTLIDIEFAQIEKE